MSSFLRARPQYSTRRRYDNTYDSKYRVLPHRIETSIRTRPTYLYYNPSFEFITTDRPYSPRMEVELQFTFFAQCQLGCRDLEALHILICVQLCCRLVSLGTERYPGLLNPFAADLPILKWRKNFARHFCGPSVTQFIFQQLYRLFTQVDFSSPPGEHELHNETSLILQKILILLISLML